ncbi:MAG TPA: serine/threonine-protein kinase, partial [Thermoanaerobaculia bacterium]|nr:serine/threonine-protein kinase [Thermoanaerobaculia bacterium]
MAIAPGTRLGPYEILVPIGAGGMGEVYRAKDPRLGREVAIKVLPASFSFDPERLRRFEQEARAAGLLNHPNITAVYDIGTENQAPYVVTELLEGETLRGALAGGRLSARKAVDYALQIAHGLAAAHEKGIVHRDLKPENLFVTKDGRVKILDFGLAKLTHTEEGSGVTNLPTATAGTEPGVVLGTLGYMSPEQVRGRPADARSDIFSFGAILYEMLSGKRAFHGDSAADTMSAILREDPPELSVTNQNISPGLDRIVRHCLEKNPEQRFHSAHDLAFDLETLSGVSAPRSAAAGAAPV